MRAWRFLLLALVLSWVGAPPSAAWQDSWDKVERIVAIGDVHGDYEAFTYLLRGSGVTDEQGRWSGGRTHLVQIGDVVDRGPDSRKCLDLLMALEKPARRAGGAVHALIGNHEAMNVSGDLRYVSAGEFAAFRDSDSGRLRERYYRRHVREMRAGGGAEPGGEYRRQWMDARPLGYFELLAAFAPTGDYGGWIARHNAIVRINDIVFVHGGISPKFAGLEMREINDRVRAGLRAGTLAEGGILSDPDGPLWYRGLASGDEAALAPHVDSVLDRFGAKHVVVGHTPTRGAIDSRFGGKVLVIDTGISRAYGGRRACLVVESGRQYALDRGRRIGLPRDSSADLQRYRAETGAAP